MASKYEKTQGTEVMVSSLPAEKIGDTATADFVGFNCSVTGLSIGRGQKQDIDVTTLCSTTQEMINGLSAPGEVSFNVNWAGRDAGQKILEKAYNDDLIHEFRIILPSGEGFTFLAEVRDFPIEVSTNAVATSTITLRVSKGAVQRIEPDTTPGGDE